VCYTAAAAASSAVAAAAHTPPLWNQQHCYHTGWKQKSQLLLRVLTPDLLLLLTHQRAQMHSYCRTCMSPEQTTCKRDGASEYAPPADHRRRCCCWDCCPAAAAVAAAARALPAAAAAEVPVAAAQPLLLLLLVGLSLLPPFSP
jgi:hypothetical protein